jgi:polyphosphate glucokinase
MPRQLIGIDVGGSSIKAGLVDLDAGRLVGDLKSAPTPKPSTPAAMLAVFQELVGRFPGSQGKVGIAMPSVVKHGKVCTAANIDHGWIGVHGPTLVEKPLGRQVIFLNDADAAGVAEVKWGAGKGIKGTAIMLTFGTGIGTAFFVDGILLPNSELGHMQLPRHGEAEKWTSAHVRTAEKLDWPAWIERVNVYLAELYNLFWPDLFILGGAVSERFDEFAPLLHSEAQIKPAAFAGQAGVIGAALAAADA